ncbi:peptide deformylase [Limosilactobacillus agrestis]|uniref:Peptide deformylase n=1 Tax=Limosilactobacillus agrestis TaxID=2759748 RepID=A0ABS8R801_9LACO|nr:peptide deformylase [Limosilactobacillus agrestis]MBD5090182.1 peptide deformylase [Lactobacillus sp.]MBB1099780.1 peptide deformylase [Limosilactobacillus agrestis]MCD7120526.1 peptide deformylase [Limosilactobacillus agrestis]MCD7127085.1 peptide deformylase [Limosilactobacillus agrestis]MCD7130474.1 peptide deformylase [Limosilactobacillus agrestis]
MIKPIIEDQQLLATKSTPVTKTDLSLANDLIETLNAHQAECVGMAANMIGVNKNAIIARIGPFNVVMFNPQIITKSHPYQTTEGCLSLSGTRPTKRYKQITVKFRNQNWQVQTLELTDFAAEIVQHEIDHCNGIII